MPRDRLLKVRVLLAVFSVSLIVSGATAIPLQWEVALLDRWIGALPGLARWVPGLPGWIALVHQGVKHGYGQYPFLAYGTDWLAFGHVAIAVAFVGPFRDPRRNLWVIDFGLIVCAMVVPWTLLFAPARGIPPFWMAVDASFGVVGFIPLWIARRLVARAS